MSVMKETATIAIEKTTSGNIRKELLRIPVLVAALGYLVDMYDLFLFSAGFGLAGELGAGITLVTEILPNKIRGYGSTIVATMGVMGALLAYLVSFLFNWRASYFIGGGLGLLLMVLRIKVFESGIFI